MARTTRKAILPALALGALLAGCAGTPGTAAVVDGERLTDRDLQTMVHELAELVGQEFDMAQTVVLYARAEPIIQAAAEANMTVPRSQLEEALRTQALTAELQVDGDDLNEGTVLVVHSLVLEPYALNDPTVAARFVELLDETEVEMNPRYGTFTDSGLGATDHPWLVLPHVGEEQAPAL